MNKFVAVGYQKWSVRMSIHETIIKLLALYQEVITCKEYSFDESAEIMQSIESLASKITGDEIGELIVQVDREQFLFEVLMIVANHNISTLLSTLAKVFSTCAAIQSDLERKY